MILWPFTSYWLYYRSRVEHWGGWVCANVNKGGYVCTNKGRIASVTYACTRNIDGRVRRTTREVGRRQRRITCCRSRQRELTHVNFSWVCSIAQTVFWAIFALISIDQLFCCCRYYYASHHYCQDPVEEPEQDHPRLNSLLLIGSKRLRRKWILTSFITIIIIIITIKPAVQNTTQLQLSQQHDNQVY